MPDPQRLLHTLRRAAGAFRSTPGRRGRLLHLADAAEVLVVGDLHGHVANFSVILQRADLGRHPRRHLLVQELVHGPFRYPVGGDKSHQLVDLVAALKCQYPGQVHYLLGNHELAEARGRPVGKEDDDLNELFLQGVRVAYGPAADDIYTAYRELFGVIPLAVRTANRVFLSHSLPSAARMQAFDPAALERDTHAEAELAPRGGVHALLWGRDTSPANAATFLARVDADWLVTGHVPCEAGFAIAGERHLILDAKGAPGCFCLFPADRAVIQQDLIAGIHTI
jgi:hypothetical protein